MTDRPIGPYTIHRFVGRFSSKKVKAPRTGSEAKNARNVKCIDDDDERGPHHATICFVRPSLHRMVASKLWTHTHKNRCYALLGYTRPGVSLQPLRPVSPVLLCLLFECFACRAPHLYFTLTRLWPFSQWNNMSADIKAKCTHERMHGPRERA